ncbi:MAG: glucose-6-phosphate isomerase [Deltaproteobacteria bacterium]|nr:glucose-6-phosphate isomerase [Deltaproteobacteria bacterium]
MDKKTIVAPNEILFDFSRIGDIKLDPLGDEIRLVRERLESGDVDENDCLGWLKLPKPSIQFIEKVEEAAQNIRESDALVVIGIGGSYRGSKAVIESLSPAFGSGFPIYFAGHHLDSDYHKRLLNHLKDKRYSVVINSKSGTTTEPEIAFRLFWRDLQERFSKDDLKRLVYITTDKARGPLRKLADVEELTSFTIPDDVGGRFSVLTPVGLLAIASAGLNIRELLAGARDMMDFVREPTNNNLENNPALSYAAFRNASYRGGKKIEAFGSYTPSLGSFVEWWKQLFGESEGKDNKGILPTALNLTVDLHTLGQWLQDGERTVFETIIDVVHNAKLIVPSRETYSDEHDFLSDIDMHDVNRIVVEAALTAHFQGGVPCLRIQVPELNERIIGSLLFFFEYACAISAYVLGVNPFDQPGVEAYKKNMHSLLRNR